MRRNKLLTPDLPRAFEIRTDNKQLKNKIEKNYKNKNEKQKKQT